MKRPNLADLAEAGWNIGAAVMLAGYAGVAADIIGVANHLISGATPENVAAAATGAALAGGLTAGTSLFVGLGQAVASFRASQELG